MRFEPIDKYIRDQLRTHVALLPPAAQSLARAALHYIYVDRLNAHSVHATGTHIGWNNYRAYFGENAPVVGSALFDHVVWVKNDSGFHVVTEPYVLTQENKWERPEIREGFQKLGALPGVKAQRLYVGAHYPGSTEAYVFSVPGGKPARGYKSYM